MIDIGVNLTNKAFERDRDAVIERALDAGLEQLIVTGTDVAASQAALGLARTRPARLRATAGVHPHDADRVPADWASSLRTLLSVELVCAVGETGLDFNRNYSSQDAQERVFIAQLELAAECGKPVFVHDRDSAGRLAAILKEHRSALSDVVIHCFTGTAAELSTYLELDCHIGITGWVADERRGQALATLVPSIPLTQLMIETDAPYLLPRNMSERPRDRRNEPAFLSWVARAVADCYGLPVATIAAVTAANARRFFRLAEQAEIESSAGA